MRARKKNRRERKVVVITKINGEMHVFNVLQ